MKSNPSNFITKPERQSHNHVMTVSIVVLLVVHLIIILRRAWLCDDAYITFRTVDNLVNGYKLTWNTIERVQAFTHPLWMLLLSSVHYFFRDIYSSSITLSLLISMAAITLAAFKVARSRTAALILVFLLTLSNAYIDYSTSGLENHLSHLLLVVFCIIYFVVQPSMRRMLLLSLIASLAGVNRLDTMLFYLPALAYAFWECHTKKIFLAALVGQVPLILWESFSLFYYGFLFPNTAFAKLNTGIPANELLAQGLNYLFNSLQNDPLTLATIITSIVVTVLFRDKRIYALLGGMLVYLIYLVDIGGDFMSGRFLSAPFLVAVIIISRSDLNHLKIGYLVPFAVSGLALALLAPEPFYRVLPADGIKITDDHGITNERLWYFGDFGLFSPTRTDLALSAGRNGVKARRDAAGDLYVIAIKNTGVFGYYGGPSLFVIDQYALSDPLLARLPAEKTIRWRVGHYSRVIPAGYIATIYKLGRMGDENLAQYYDKLAIITGSKLFSLQRLEEIWKMNTGAYDNLINHDAYRYPDMVFTSLTQLNALADPGESDLERIAFQASGIEIDLGEIKHAKHMGICLESNDDYSVEYRRDDTTLEVQMKFATSGDAGLMCYLLEIPRNVFDKGFNKLRIFPEGGNGEYGVGHLRLVE